MNFFNLARKKIWILRKLWNFWKTSPWKYAKRHSLYWTRPAFIVPNAFRSEDHSGRREFFSCSISRLTLHAWMLQKPYGECSSDNGLKTKAILRYNSFFMQLKKPSLHWRKISSLISNILITNLDVLLKLKFRKIVEQN
mgnify:CR=1 FL=1